MSMRPLISSMPRPGISSFSDLPISHCDPPPQNIFFDSYFSEMFEF